MNLLSKQLKTLKIGSVVLLDKSIEKYDYCPINLSTTNNELNNYNIQNPTQCQKYIDTVLSINNAKVAFGGYLEKRNLYGDKSSFTSDKNPRNIHLGIDFWTLAGTNVIAPLDGIVHSFQNNKAVGDYGPTIILKHQYADFSFHTLYGHLSLASLKNLVVGMSFKAGDVLATLGTPVSNVNYAPHLHFQIIADMEGKFGDYPGVCSSDTLDFYSKNCPNPNILLQMYP